MAVMKTTRPPTPDEQPGVAEAFQKRISYQAMRFSGKFLPLRICLTQAGFYIGCFKDGEPCGRDSGYYESFADADSALWNRTWTQRMDP